MKKILLLVLLCTGCMNSFACSICGCGGSNVYFGLLPDFSGHFISLRYQYAQYHTLLANDRSQFSNNYYHSMEILAGFKLSKNIKVLAIVPYQSNKQVDDDGTGYKKGLGDITIIGQYRVINNLWIGAGIKMPTGAFNIDPRDSSTTVADINAQLGTGSIDYLLNGLYTISIGSFGLNTSASYKINTRNKNDYVYGNKLSINCIGSYRITTAKNGISPNLGIGYEHTGSNVLGNAKVAFTGSYVTTVLAGVEFSRNRIVFGINAQLPVSQNFAEGQTQLKLKAMAHISFAL